jgi:hypothetical protein
VATIKAPAGDILRFAAYHLELGAHRLHIFLDEPNPRAQAALKAHPKIRVTTCDAAHWRRLGRQRPKKHQLRQGANASFAYGRESDVDWLIHMDVDEFLWPDTPVGEILAALPADILCARVRPVESLAGDGSLYKGFLPPGPAREATVARLYPTFGAYVKGGFLSHLAGKVLVRTGLGPLTLRIHNVFRGDEQNPGETELGRILLCHRHAKDWDDWIAAFRYRLEHGSYRAELPAARPREKGGMSLHELLSFISDSEGEAGLRAFHDELCAASPNLLGRLEKEGLLVRCDLELDAMMQKHFPDFQAIVSK